MYVSGGYLQEVTFGMSLSGVVTSGGDAVLENGATPEISFLLKLRLSVNLLFQAHFKMFNIQWTRWFSTQLISFSFSVKLAPFIDILDTYMLD